MTVKFNVKIMEVYVSNPVQKLILLKLRNNANDKGQGRPSLFGKSYNAVLGLLLGAMMFSSQHVFAELNWISASWDNDVMAGLSYQSDTEPNKSQTARKNFGAITVVLRI